MLSICPPMRSRAPVPSAATTTTAAMPIRIPSAVSAVRSFAAPSADERDRERAQRRSHRSTLTPARQSRNETPTENAG